MRMVLYPHGVEDVLFQAAATSFDTTWYAHSSIIGASNGGVPGG